MSEKFAVVVDTVASGTNKTILNLFNPVATPLTRAKVSYILVGAPGTPGDQAANFVFQRTTAVGTEGAGCVPVNLDLSGPGGEYDSGVGVFSAEPTYTALKILLQLPMNQRSTVQWYCVKEGFELKLPATQNTGGGIKSITSTSTQPHGCTVLFET